MPTKMLGEGLFYLIFRRQKSLKKQPKLMILFTFKKVTELCNFILEN